MRKIDIEVGSKYFDGKGGIREVIAEGPEFTMYLGQKDGDAIRYRVIAKKFGPYRVGALRCCTRTKFAAWAKGRVE